MSMFELNQRISLAGHYIGANDPVYIIAEMSANHLQDYNRAIEIIHAAKEAGVDAIKLQTYTADTITIDSDKSYFQITGGTIWDGTTLHKLYEEAYTPWDWQPKLCEEAKKLGLDPSDCVAYEDSLTGIESAHRAGMITVMVPDFLQPTEEIKPMINKLCNTLDESIEFLKTL